MTKPYEVTDETAEQRIRMAANSIASLQSKAVCPT